MAHEETDHEHAHSRDHDPGHRHGHRHDHAHGHTQDEHRAHAPASVACYVVTCSDSRTPKSDASGRVLREQLEGAGHSIVGQALIRDEPAELRKILEETAPSVGARAVIISGGTGIGRRDTTYETVSALLEKRIDGFGELFRFLSFQEIGPAAMLSRAVAGTFRGMVIFALPGSPAAARLALERLILPELGHAVRVMSR